MAGVAPAVLGMKGELFGQVGKGDILCGMIGTGGRGRSVLEAIVKVPGVRVAALCEINPKELEKAMAIVGSHQPKTYVYHRDLLDQTDLDAIFVETPPHLHREHAVEALLSGRHCSIAKPLALTVNELNDIYDVAKKTGKIVHVDQQLRYRPQYLEAMERIHRGDIGDVGFVRAQRYDSWNGKKRSGSYRDRKGWLYRIDQSGDTIVENQIHNIDVINWIMNSHPIRATGFGGQNMVVWDENELLDAYGLTFEYPGERYAVFSKISYAVPALTGTFIHAYGSKAGADCSYDGAVTIYWRGEGNPEPTVIDTPEPDMNHLSVTDFFQAIREGRQPKAGVEIGYDAAVTTLMGRRAIYQKKVIEWEDVLAEGVAPRLKT